MFDNTLMTLISLSLVGTTYFLLYRFIGYHLLHWKMIHSIWIPILAIIGFSILGVSLLTTTWFGANRNVLSVLGVFFELNLPMLVYFVLYIISWRFDQKAKFKKQAADSLI